MKKISLVLASAVYILPGVLAVLAHTNVIKSSGPRDEFVAQAAETKVASVDSTNARITIDYLVLADKTANR